MKAFDQSGAVFGARRAAMPVVNRPALGQSWQPAPTGTPAQGGATWTPQPPPVNRLDGPTEITLSVLEPTVLDGFKGAKITVEYLPITVPHTVHVPGPAPVPPGAVGAVSASGQTDAEGRYVFRGTAPSPNTAFFWRLTIEPGPDTAGFPRKTVDVPTRSVDALASGAGAQYVSRSSVSAMVCPSGVDALVCAVAEAQVAFAGMLAQCEVAWGSSPQAKSFCADQAHANVPLNHPRLKARWDVFSWWVGDFSIPPKDWPRLLDNLDQTIGVFNSVPFPRLPGAEDLWIRCARGIPLWKGMSVANPKLYVSDYFPREDRKIEVDMAFQYLVNIPAIGKCIEHRIKKKAQEIERSARAWRMMGLATTFMLAPIAGSSAPSLMITELAEYGYTMATGNIVPSAVSTIATGGVSIASAGLTSDALEKMISAGLDLLMKEYGTDLDPTVQKVIGAAAPKAVSAGVTDLLSGTTTVSSTPQSGAGDFISLQSVGSAAAAMAVKFVANTISATGVRGVGDFKKLILGLQDLPAIMVPFIIWAIRTLLLDKLFEAAAQMAEQDLLAAGAPPPAAGETPVGGLDMTGDVVGPLVGQAEADGVEVPSSATEERDPVLEATAGPSTAGILATAGIGVGAIVAALFVGGVFGGK